MGTLSQAIDGLARGANILENLAVKLVKISIRSVETYAAAFDDNDTGR
jgi:hypothetical protein